MFLDHIRDKLFVWLGNQCEYMVLTLTQIYLLFVDEQTPDILELSNDQVKGVFGKAFHMGFCGSKVCKVVC